MVELRGSKTGFIAAVKQCSGVEEVKVLHGVSIGSGQVSDLYVGNSLMSAYARSGHMQRCRRLFDGMSYHSLVSWNVLILGFASNGEGELALYFFRSMRDEEFTADALSLAAALRACTSLAVRRNGGVSLGMVLNWGKELHLLALKCGALSHALVASNLINMYAHCRCPVDARRVFESSFRGCSLLISAWNSLMLAHTEAGDGGSALELFDLLMKSSLSPNSVTFYAALKACVSLGFGDRILEKGRQIHSEATRFGFDDDAHVAGAVVSLYTSCGTFDDARRVLDEKFRLTSVWNSLMRGYVENGKEQAALELFARMEGKATADAGTYLTVFKACTKMAAGEKTTLIDGKSIRMQSLEKARRFQREYRKRGFAVDSFVASSLVSLYSECGSMVDARRVFDETPEPRGVVLWNALLLGHSENGDEELSLEMFLQSSDSPPPDALTFVALLKSCKNLACEKPLLALENGKFIHHLAARSGFESDMTVGNCLVEMYGKCCSVMNSWLVFDAMASLSSVSWTSLMLGCSEAEQSLKLFKAACETLVPDSRLLVAALRACSSLVSVDGRRREEVRSLVKRIHSQAPEKLDSYLASALVELYCKCGDLPTARETLLETDQALVPWTMLMLGYVDNDEGELALDLYKRQARFTANSHVYAAVIKACGSVAAAEDGKLLHSELCMKGSESTRMLGTCLVEMYCKLGSLEIAQHCFDSLCSRDSVLWNTLLTGYSRSLEWRRVFELFQGMLEDGFNPLGVSFVAILTACSHGGLVRDGEKWLEMMEKRYGVFPDKGHYTCVVDLLSRADELGEALELLERMPGDTPADASTWTCILGACSKLRNEKLGRVAFQSIVELDQKGGSAYTLLANSCL